MKEQYVAAIDIGTTKIVSIVGKRTEDGKLEILRLSKTRSTGVNKGVVQNILQTENAIRNTVQDVQQNTGIEFSEVFVGIAGQHIRSMKSRGYITREFPDDVITKEDILRLIEDMRHIHVNMGEEIIDIIPQNFIVDNEPDIKNPIGMCGSRLEANFYIVIGQITAAKNIEKCVSRVGLKMQDLILEPLASADAVLTDDEKEQGVALVDIGGGTTDIAIYYDKVIRYTAVIPFGGNAITNDIKEGCSIPPKYAEALKIQYGSALRDTAPSDRVVSIPGINGRDPKEISFKNLAGIIQSRMEEIIEVINYEIQNSGCADKLIAGIVITGGGAMLKDLTQLMKFKTALDVRIGYPNANLTGSAKKEINEPMFSTAVGLILHGFNYLDTFHRPADTKDTEEPSDTAEDTENEENDISDSDNTQKKPNAFDKIKKMLSKLFEVEEQPID